MYNINKNMTIILYFFYHIDENEIADYYKVASSIF